MTHDKCKRNSLRIFLNNENRCHTFSHSFTEILSHFNKVSLYFKMPTHCVEQLYYDDFLPDAFRYSLERVHSEGDVHAWAVREEGSQGGLLKQSKDQDLVPETRRGKN